MMFRKRERYPYNVTVHLNGRHPYLESNELDYETRDVVLTVPARDWNEAAKVAREATRRLAYWSCHVVAIARAGEQG